MDLVYACYLNSEKDVAPIKHNLSKLEKFCDKIFIIYSVSSSLKDFDMTEYVNPSPELPNIAILKTENKGYDFYKYKIGIDLNVNPSDEIIFMNDSFFFVRDIEDIVYIIKNKIKYDYKFIGLNRCDSPMTGHKEHYQSFFWVLSKDLLTEFSDRLEGADGMNLDEGTQSIIKKYEIGISNYFINKYKSFSIYNVGLECLWPVIDLPSRPGPLENLLSDGFPIIKKQCLKRTKYNDIFQKGNEITDFDPRAYKELHSDLRHLNSQELEHHFFHHGVFEGRKYKESQEVWLPPKIENCINELNTNLKYYE